MHAIERWPHFSFHQPIPLYPPSPFILTTSTFPILATSPYHSEFHLFDIPLLFSPCFTSYVTYLCNPVTRRGEREGSPSVLKRNPFAR